MSSSTTGYSYNGQSSSSSTSSDPLAQTRLQRFLNEPTRQGNILVSLPNQTCTRAESKAAHEQRAASYLRDAGRRLP
ncbi:hypothetical protein QBC37DRAFT_422830 [Rhypophila decipiens]|uniref:Uncharacterized protein n=1 Tax=Rhypophila decipiens TaxID=261697 RepID=A0AAN6Y7U9_9PEZI|nr:hypothetical protein QBC37DRAFT_422830 [Rhypophila decipiens]